MAIGIQSDGSMLEANVTVKNGRKKAYENKAHVVEAFKEDYIKVDLVDEDATEYKVNKKVIFVGLLLTINGLSAQKKRSHFPF